MSGTVYYVFSTAGKLIYSSAASHAEEEQAATHVGVLQTLISIYADDSQDRLRHIHYSSPSSATSIVFLLRPPLYLTAIATTSPLHLYPHPPPALLRIHLDALHLQLTSIVPAPKLIRLFSQRPNYDLRARMLTGTEPFLHRLIASLSNNTAPPPPYGTGTEGGWPWLLGALQPIKMDPALRSQLGSALQPPLHDQQRSSSSSPSLPSPAAAPTPPTETSSIITSVGTVTSSTLSLLNPVSYLLPSQGTPPPPSTTVKRPKDLLYALVLFQSQLITLLRPRKHSVHAADMHLLINAARASISSRSREGGTGEDLESWVPVCLPRFASGGFVWAHVSLLPKEDTKKDNEGVPQSSSSNIHHHPHLKPRRPAMPTNHVSTATASSATSTTSTLHVPDGLPSTSTSTAQAVASAMRSSLRSAATSPSPLSASSRSSSSAQIASIHNLPSSTSLASTGIDPDETVRTSVDIDDEEGDRDDVQGVGVRRSMAGDDSRVGSPALGGDSHAASETASVADTETETDRQLQGDADGEGMDEAQEAELMASISALRSRPNPPPPTPSRQPSSSSTSSSPPLPTDENQTTPRYDNDDEDLTLVLVSGDPDAFLSLSLWRTQIIQSLTSKKIIQRLVESTSIPSSEFHPATPPKKGTSSSSSYSADELRIPGLRHFIYKSRVVTQLTAPRFESPYLAEEGEEAGEGGGGAWRRLVGLYGVAWDGLHAPGTPPPELFGLDLTKGVLPPPAEKKKVENEADEGEDNTTTTTTDQQHPTLIQTKLTWTSSTTTYTFLRTQHEAVLGVLTASFELYVCVSPWMRRKGVVGLSSKVAGWVKGREEELFLLAPPVF
ncbi:hypothetical protein CF319_g3004 [Tilletia indica]|nr:hypothetical protein CF319_g3004 [Tilletia indica]